MTTREIQVTHYGLKRQGPDGDPDHTTFITIKGERENRWLALETDDEVHQLIKALQDALESSC